MTIAIVPMSRLARAKSRLAGALPDTLRERLVLTMFEDVLVALSACRAFSAVFVVTPDNRISGLAATMGAEIFREDVQHGLNPAVASALAQLRTRSADRLLIVPGDLPFATPDEFARVSSALDAGADVALVPAHDGLGTNALVLAASLDFTPMFGPSSYARHLEQAHALGLTARTLALRGIGRDIDTSDDLDMLAKRNPAERYAFLMQPRRGASSIHIDPASRTVFHADSEETPS